MATRVVGTGRPWRSQISSRVRVEFHSAALADLSLQPSHLGQSAVLQWLESKSLTNGEGED